MMFTDPYFTQEDARFVAGFLQTLFADIQCEVLYCGIYGKMGTPGKLAYAIRAESSKWGMQRRITSLETLSSWLTWELGKEQGERVVSLLRSVATDSAQEEVQG